MTMSESERAERCERQRELADRLRHRAQSMASSSRSMLVKYRWAVDDGLLKGMLNAALERG
jgi:hypothetical protein